MYHASVRPKAVNPNSSKVVIRVEYVFDLTNQGVVCAPFIQLPPSGLYQTFTAVVTVKPPDSAAFDVEASFSVTHFKILDLTVPVEKRWQIVTCLGKIPKDSVPVGSVILCDDEVRNRLLHTI